MHSLNQGPDAAEIFDATPIGLAVVDTQFRVLRLNRSWPEGFRRMELPAPLESLFPGIPDWSRAHLRASMETLLSGETEMTAVALPNSAAGGDDTFPLSLELYRLRTPEPTVLLAIDPARPPMEDQFSSSQHLVMDAIPERIVFHDPDMRILWANRAALADAGATSPGEIVGRRCYEIWGDDRSICAACPVREVLESHAAGDDATILSRDGKHWSIRAFPVHSGTGNVFMGVVEIARDVTDIRAAQLALRESEEWYRTTLNSVSDGIIVTDRHGRVILANPAAERIAGWRDEAATGQHIASVFRLVDEESGRDATAALVATLSSGQATETADGYLLETREGRSIPVEHSVTPIRTDSTSIRGAMLVFRDISRRRRGARSLRAREREFRTLAENAPDIIARFDRRIRLTYSNQSLESMLGIPVALAHERSPREMDLEEGLGAAWEDALRDGLYRGRKVTRNVAVGRGGEQRSFVIDVVPEFGEADDVNTLLSVIRDTSSVDRIARDLAAQNRRLGILAEAASRFVDFPHGTVDYDVITGYLFDMTDALCAFICTFEGETGELWVRSLAAEPATLEALRECMEVEPKGTRWTIDSAKLDGVERGTLFPVDGLSEMTDGTIPPSLAREIEERLGIGDLLLVGLTMNGRVLGTLGMAMPRSVALRDAHLVEAYSHAVVGALITAEAEKALADSEEKYRNLAEAGGDGILIVQGNRIQYANGRFAEMIGSPERDLLQTDFTSYFRPEEIPELLSRHHRRLAGENIDPISETVLLARDGREIPVEVNVQVFDYRGQPAVLSFVRDITERKRSEEHLQYVSLHDQLTGLYNRSYFEDSLERLDVPRQLPISIIVGDVNGLKIVNDGFGVEAGNAVLRQIAATMGDICRSEDIVARIGSDEFAILLPATDREGAQRVIDRIRHALQEALTDPVPISVSLGWSAKMNPEDDIHSIFGAAESAMHRDKMLEMASVRSAIMTSLTETLRATSLETEEHAERMEELALAVGRRIDMADSHLANLAMVARLHDIGKVGVPGHILQKPGKLTEREWKIVSQHPDIGARIAASLPDLEPIVEDIRSHHERWDGAGYPRGLSGNEIPLIARIVSLVDAFDVMTSGRPYQRAKTEEEALREIRDCAGTQFDPEIADVFLEIAEEYDIG